MRKSCFLVIVAAAATLGGCNVTTYEVSMSRAGAMFDRSLTVTRSDSGKGDKPKSTTSITRFAGATPDDVGGAGTIDAAITSMGTLSVYTERFRGTTDPAGSLVKLLGAADRVADAALGWLHHEIGGTPEHDKLARFVGGELRADLKNLAVYLYLDDGSRDSQSSLTDSVALARCYQYIVEHGYMKPEQVPAFARTMSHPKDDSITAFSEFLKPVLLQKAGLAPGSISPETKAFLDDPPGWQKSFIDFLASTPQYQELAKQAAATGKPEPPPTDVLRLDELGGWAAIRIWSDQLHLTLAMPGKPLATNGTWDDAAGKVTWNVWLGARGSEGSSEFPFVAFARWVEPDAAFQQAHFGRVLLDGQKLEEYCLWRKALTQAEGDQWDAALASLTPSSSDVAGILRNKCPAIDDDTRQDGINLIMNALVVPLGKTTGPSMLIH